MPFFIATVNCILHNKLFSFLPSSDRCVLCTCPEITSITWHFEKVHLVFTFKPFMVFFCWPWIKSNPAGLVYGLGNRMLLHLQQGSPGECRKNEKFCGGCCKGLFKWNSGRIFWNSSGRQQQATHYIWYTMITISTNTATTSLLLLLLPLLLLYCCYYCHYSTITPPQFGRNICSLQFRTTALRLSLQNPGSENNGGLCYGSHGWGIFDVSVNVSVADN